MDVIAGSTRRSGLEGRSSVSWRPGRQSLPSPVPSSAPGPATSDEDDIGTASAPETNPRKKVRSTIWERGQKYDAEFESFRKMQSDMMKRLDKQQQEYRDMQQQQDQPHW